MCLCQTEAMEADGFQADTEEDEEEDCIIISTPHGELCRMNENLLTVNVYHLKSNLGACFGSIFWFSTRKHSSTMVGSVSTAVM